MTAPRLRSFLAAAALVILVVALAPLTAGAQESGDVGSAVTSFGLGDWLGLMARLALVVAVIWAAVVAMRWWVRRMQAGGGRKGLGTLEVIETHALGPNRALHLVRLGDRAVLVGATQERITQLMTVEDPEELKRLLERPETSERPARAAAAVPILSAFRTGLVAMLEQRRRVAARARVDRAERRSTRGAVSSSAAPTPAGAASANVALVDAAPAEADAADQGPSRLGALRGLFSRRPVPVAPAAEPQPEARPSLFDRTLASVEAIEVAAPAPTAAGLRARDSYGRAGTAPAPTSTRGRSMRSRDEQIAELQRAIAAARKQAG